MLRTISVMSSLLAIAACTSGEASLAFTASPRTIDALGQTTEIVVFATDARGNAGRGTVTLDPSAGTLADTTLLLDASGSARTSFSCTATSDQACVGLVIITGKWSVGGVTVDGQVKVTVAGVDAGVRPTTTGPLAFPVGAVYPAAIAQTASGIDLIEIDVSSSDVCYANPFVQAQSNVRLTFVTSGIPTGTYPVYTSLNSFLGLASSASYSHTEALPDGGLVATEAGIAQSGTCHITQFDPADAGRNAIRAAGTFELLIRVYDGGLVPLSGNFEINCPR